MLALFRKLKASGVPTGLLSNSWGGGYPQELFPDMFNVVGDLGRGRHAQTGAAHLHARGGAAGAAPQECVFIDDIQANIISG